MKPIMELLPDDLLNYDQLRIIFSILEFEYGIQGEQESEDPTPFKRKIPSWIPQPGENSGSEDVVYNQRKKLRSLFAA